MISVRSVWGRGEGEVMSYHRWVGGRGGVLWVLFCEGWVSMLSFCVRCVKEWMGGEGGGEW